MDAINKLLDKAKEMRSIPTDIALAAELGVVRSAISNYRHGRAYPDTVTSARIAEMTGEPLARVLGIIGEARALSKDEKQVWRRLASAAALACLMLSSYALPSPTQAAIADSEQDAGLGIMRSVRRVARFVQQALSRLMDRAHDPSPLLA